MGFEIAGFSQDLLDKFSQRSAQRDAAIQEFTNSRGRAPTDNEVAVLVRKRGLTSFRRCRPSESVTFSKTDCQWMRDKDFVRF
jgi:hypothetical protein